jgi:hypothetical protein
MQPSDIRRRQQLNLKIEYISEDLLPEPGMPKPVIINEEPVKIMKWSINRMFHFLAGTSVTCLAVVAAVPNPAVQGTACAICAGSFGLAKVTLAKAYRQGAKTKKSKK